MALVIGLLVAVAAQREAGADLEEHDVDASCTSPIGPQAVEIPTDVDDTPDPVEAGEEMTVSYSTEYPGNVESSFDIEMAEVTWPMPPEVESIDDVYFTNLGTFTADSPSIDHVNMTVTATFHDGGTGRPQTPTVNVDVTIDETATGTIEWKVFDEQKSTASGVPFIGTVNSTCTPSGDSVDQTLNSTEVTGGTTTTTSSTTTSSTTTTTAPPEPGTCTQTASDDGWTKTIWGVGPGGGTQSDAGGSKMYTTDDGLNRFQSSFKFPVVGGACAEGGTLPADVTVTDATLQLTKTQNCICNGPVHRVYKITESWSEGDLHPTSGPSIAGSASDEFSTPGLDNTADIESAQLTADVQDFVDTPANNQGWSLRQRYNGSGDTGNNATPAGWATREHSTSGERPQLVITYEA